MDGKTLACGAVAAVENIRHPAALARRVMEKTPHVFLVGEGARTFAVEQGFPLQNLNTPESLVEWQKQDAARRARSGGGERKPGDHDTVAVLACDQRGNIAGACSTSGLAHKVPGRVGDSPIITCGLYADNEGGAAGATGEGEEIIRIGGSLIVVEAMRAGKSAQQACEAAIGRVNDFAVRRGVHPASVAFLALHPDGRIGGACTPRTNFEYAVFQAGKVTLIRAPEIAPRAR
jgi:isoaspartyl peptidase/L-asparaginase-like protein (Ntn-hydrolase superfamily)